MSARERGTLLYRLADLMDQHKEELATIEAIDSGAVYTLALKTHVGMSIDTWRYMAGWYVLLTKLGVFSIKRNSLIFPLSTRFKCQFEIFIPNEPAQLHLKRNLLCTRFDFVSTLAWRHKSECP